MTESGFKTTVLPNADEMLRRLTEVFDDPHAKERLYPIILRSAECELAGIGVVLMLQLAIHDYALGMPPFMGSLLQPYVPRYVEALVDDPDVKADAMAMIEQVNAEMRQG